MPTPFSLPYKDQLGFCNILLSALGGDGANMAAKLLFKVGCTEFGLDGGYGAKYGSEKKGTATDVSVRFCEVGTPVRQAGPTNRPHILGAFHESLIEPLRLWQGLQPDAIVVVNSTRSPAEVRETMHLHSGKIVCVDATLIAYDTHSRLNMPMLAAVCHEVGFPDEKIKEIVAKQWPKAADANLAAFDRALETCASEAFSANGFPLVEPGVSYGQVGWKNMLNGGTIDALTHSTIGRDNRVAAQGRVPIFDPEACTSCGICMTVCSDPGGLLWQEGRLEGIDDRFCKGCMRCVEVCPTTKKGHALEAPSPQP